MIFMKEYGLCALAVAMVPSYCEQEEGKISVGFVKFTESLVKESAYVFWRSGISV